MLVAFEGLNGVGKTTYINSLFQLLKESNNVEVITSKPTEDKLRKENLYEIFTNSNFEDGPGRLKLAGLFLKRQNELSKKFDFTSDTIYIADRWVSSTVVYTVYADILKDDDLLKDVRAYHHMISTGEDLNVNFLLCVSSKIKQLIRKLLSKLPLISGVKPVYPSHVVYIVNDDAIRMRSKRESNLVSRYELENLDDVISVIYSIYNVMLTTEYGVEVIEVSISVEDESKYEENIRSITNEIYSKLFQNQDSPVNDTCREKEVVDSISNEETEEKNEEESKDSLDNSGEMSKELGLESEPNNLNIDAVKTVDVPNERSNIDNRETKPTIDGHNRNYSNKGYNKNYGNGGHNGRKK